MSETELQVAAKRALGLIDLTNLNDDCTPADIEKLIERSSTPHGHVAAICIYAPFIKQAAELLKGSPVRIATVVNFPHGGEDTLAVVKETEAALADGADEIDLVMPYRAFMDGRRGFAETQISEVRKVIGEPALLKVILETGEMQDPRLIHVASEIAIAQGADFIKTSTGKVKVNATLEAAEIMLNVIREMGKENHRPVGFKPAGGIRSVEDAKNYLDLADKLMGQNWVSAASFRFGASGLLDAVLAEIEGRTNLSTETY
ncbi:MULTISPECIES: deoxyribose-phosphate aldolase [Pseudovibrio]|uniref:deoxyribose-phosphate aldolase n=1 Tax=Stappiaceae TaxID=2821832 RepID=UPI0023658D77|nr:MULTISPECIES: deoxyribose-phosphate aldolase [Pseudovibrio]MDD7910060.1 deoxyribose-phosphate aldolase [Pseudovibrio exalbescens]MDX5592343.1 deoxyribose-phosphate aldolase [Pseudovibrio sp. SPO723]